MKKEHSNELPAQQWAELTALAEMPDSDIDTSDAPENLDWTGARRGVFYQKSADNQMVRVDADVLEWFLAHSNETESYNAQINKALRQYVSDQERKAG